MRHIFTVLFGAMGTIGLLYMIQFGEAKDIYNQVCFATGSIICFVFCAADVLKNKIEQK